MAAPVMVFKDWPLEIAVFVEQKTGEGGKTWTEHSFKVRKTFKSTKTDTGYDTRDITLFPDDMLRLAPLLQQAYAFACTKAEVPKPKQERQRR